MLFRSSLREQDGLFLSTKSPEREGVGLSSILAVAEKHGGYAKFETKDCVFVTSVILFESG